MLGTLIAGNNVIVMCLAATGLESPSRENDGRVSPQGCEMPTGHTPRIFSLREEIRFRYFITSTRLYRGTCPACSTVILRQLYSSTFDRTHLS